MHLMLVIFGFSFLGFILHYYFSKKQRTFSEFIELLLVYQLVFNIGIMSLLAFVGFMFFPEKVAEALGWPICPFEHEMANVNLGYSVLGFLCIWIRGNFWTATIIGASVWLIGDAIGHYLNSVMENNLTPGNVGIPMYTDAIIPLILLVLLGIYLKQKRTNLPG